MLIPDVHSPFKDSSYDPSWSSFAIIHFLQNTVLFLRYTSPYTIQEKKKHSISLDYTEIWVNSGSLNAGVFRESVIKTSLRRSTTRIIRKTAKAPRGLRPRLNLLWNRPEASRGKAEPPSRPGRAAAPPPRALGLSRRTRGFPARFPVLSRPTRERSLGEDPLREKS